MLKIFYGDMESEKYIFNPDGFFINVYEDEWITDPISQQMIKDIDGSEVVGPRLIESPFLGTIPVEQLSGSVKTLILMKHDTDHILNASACGEDCAPWILKMGRETDMTIRLGYLMDFGKEQFEIEILNIHQIVHTMKELIEVVLDHHLL